MSHNPQQFDDPSLKAALQQTVGRERAGDALCQRVRERCARESAVRPGLWRHPAFRMAAALLIALVGVYVILVMRTTRAEVPQAVLASLVQRHDGCSQHQNHRAPEIPQQDFHLMGQALAGRLHIQVLAADLGAGGWTFNGAAMCPVNGQSSAHLVFAGQQGHISLFSVPPAGAVGARDGEITLQHLDGHGVAAFVRNGAVYALVNEGKQPLADAELRRMLRDHQDQLISAAVAMGIAPALPNPQ